MSRWLLAVMLAATLAGSVEAQQKSDSSKASQDNNLPPDEDAPAAGAKQPAAASKQKVDSSKAAASDDLPPDEDAPATTEKITFNPVKSKKDVSVGLFYMKKGDYKAAVDRFHEATQYNDANAEAWLRLGEADEKQGSVQAARTAYEKFLHLAPDAKNSNEVKKRLDKLK